MDRGAGAGLPRSRGDRQHDRHTGIKGIHGSFVDGVGSKEKKVILSRKRRYSESVRGQDYQALVQAYSLILVLIEQGYGRDCPGPRPSSGGTPKNVVVSRHLQRAGPRPEKSGTSAFHFHLVFHFLPDTPSSPVFGEGEPALPFFISLLRAAFFSSGP